jgi:hypothetical protein
MEQTLPTIPELPADFFTKYKTVIIIGAVVFLMYLFSIKKEKENFKQQLQELFSTKKNITGEQTKEGEQTNEGEDKKGEEHKGHKGHHYRHNTHHNHCLEKCEKNDKCLGFDIITTYNDDKITSECIELTDKSNNEYVYVQRYLKK